MIIRLKLFLLIVSIFINHLSVSKTSNQGELLFKGKNILIIGGTGYLGRLITAEIIKHDPNAIVLFSRDEVKHFNAATLFGNNPKIKHILGDMRDYEGLLEATKDIDIVLHLAAYKRIDMLEKYGPEAIRGNILGTLNVFNACVVNSVKQVLFVSTDKACSPINMYGATKFVGEKIFTNYDHDKISTKFVVVRFGNIAGSTGSIIPVFIDKIKKDEDLPLTDPAMTRFIVTKSEIIELLFDALEYGQGGEIFLKKFRSLYIKELITALQEKYNAKNQVIITGIRPGEKIHEILINRSEMERTFEFQDYYIIMPTTKDLRNIEQPPLYVSHGKKLDSSIMKKFSSENISMKYNDIKELLWREF